MMSKNHLVGSIMPGSNDTPTVGTHDFIPRPLHAAVQTGITQRKNGVRMAKLRYPHEQLP